MIPWVLAAVLWSSLGLTFWLLLRRDRSDPVDAAFSTAPREARPSKEMDESEVDARFAELIAGWVPEGEPK